MDIGEYIKSSWKGTIENVINLWVAGLIASLLSLVTLGILGGVLMTGWLMMYVKLFRDGKKPEIGDVFGYFNQFAPLFLLWLLIVVTVLLACVIFVVLPARITPFMVIPGTIIFLACSIVICTVLLYSFALIADQGKGVKESIIASKDKVVAAGFPMHIILVVVVSVISSVGGLIPYVKIVLAPFTYSIGLGIVAAAYLDHFKKEELVA